MTYKSNSMLFAAALAVALWLAPPTSSAGMEQRCTELGQDCLCSEPLVFGTAWTSHPFDAPDTEGVGSKECFASSGGRSLYTTSSTFDDIVMITGASIGLPGVEYVPEIEAQFTGSLRDNQRTMTHQTWCQRNYRQWTNDFDEPCEGCGAGGGDKRIKLGRNVKKDQPDHFDFQSGWAGSGTSHIYYPQCKPSDNWGKCENATHSGDTVDFADCRGTWCRIELCYDHNPADNRLHYRARVTSLDSSESVSEQQLFTGDFEQPYGTFIAGDNANTKMVSWFSQLITTGTTYVSHVMVAGRSYDPNFWIGPAIEIEGPRPAPPELLE